MRRAAGDLIDVAKMREKIDIAMPSGKIVQRTGVINKSDPFLVLFRVKPDLPGVSPGITAKPLRLFLIAFPIPIEQSHDPSMLQ